jgi:hypothetical protein
MIEQHPFASPRATSAQDRIPAIRRVREPRDRWFGRVVRGVRSVIGVTATVAVASAVATAPPASATPTGCSAWPHGMYASAMCSGGYGGSFQVFTTCKNAMWPFNAVFQEGPWYPAGSRRISETRCPLLFDATNAGVGLRR